MVQIILRKIADVKNQARDHRHTIEGIGLMLSFRGCQLLLGLATIYFIVHNFSVESYGHYSFILTVVSLISIFSLPSMDQAIAQSAARGFQGTYRRAVKYSFCVSLVASFILLGFSVYSFYVQQDELGVAYLIAAILFPFSIGLFQWKSLHLGEERYRRLVAIGSINSIICSICIILSAYFFPGNIALLLAAYWIVPALQNINQTRHYFQKIPKNAPEEKGSLSYGLKNSIYSVWSVIASNIDSILIFTFLSPVHLAVFAIAQKIPELIKGHIQDIGRVLLPKFSRQKHYTKKTDRFFKMFSAVVGAGILLLTFTIYPYFFEKIFGEKYVEALGYSQILMCSIALANVAPLKFWFVTSRLDIKASRDMTLLIAGTRILVSSILIPIWGLQGAVASAVVHRLITSTAIHFMLKKRYPLEGKHD